MLADAAPAFAHCDTHADFAFGLDVLLAGLDALRLTPAGTPPPGGTVPRA